MLERGNAHVQARVIALRPRASTLFCVDLSTVADFNSVLLCFLFYGPSFVLTTAALVEFADTEAPPVHLQY